jgi:hypothetical protein
MIMPGIPKSERFAILQRQFGHLKESSYTETSAKTKIPTAGIITFLKTKNPARAKKHTT